MEFEIMGKYESLKSRNIDREEEAKFVQEDRGFRGVGQKRLEDSKDRNVQGSSPARD